MDKIRIQQGLTEIIQLINEITMLVWQDTTGATASDYIITNMTEGQATSQATSQSTSQSTSQATNAMAGGEGEVLAYPGHTCFCTSCGKDVYRVVNKVHARNMGITTFINAFEPLDGAPDMTRSVIETVLRDEKGIIYADCPVCGGEKTLALIGVLAKVKSFPIHREVSSFGEEELGV